MSLMDDLKKVLSPGAGYQPGAVDSILEKAKKDAEEAGLTLVGFEPLEYKTGRPGQENIETIQVPIYKTAEEAVIDRLIDEGELIRKEDLEEDPFDDPKVLIPDYVSKFDTEGENYQPWENPYPSLLPDPSAAAALQKEREVTDPNTGAVVGYTYAAQPALAKGQTVDVYNDDKTMVIGTFTGTGTGTPPTFSSAPGQQLKIPTAADLPAAQPAFNPSTSTYDNSAAISNIVGGLSSVTAPIQVPGLGTISGSGAVTPLSTNTDAVTPAPIAEPGTVPGTTVPGTTIPGTGYQSKYDPAAAAELIAEYKANKAKEALLNPPPIPAPYDGLNRTLNPKPSSSGSNFNLPSNFQIMGTPDAQPPATQPPAAQPPTPAPTETDSQGGGLTPQQEQFMQTVKGLEKSERQRAAAERVTRQNMARAGQIADIRLGIQNGRTASGLDAFKRRFKIGQQSPSTNLMINA